MKMDNIILAILEIEDKPEQNFVVSTDDFIRRYFALFPEAREEDVFMDAMVIGQTNSMPEMWANISLADGDRISARVCQSEGMFRDFINGKYNDTDDWTMNDKLCSEECLDMIDELNNENIKESNKKRHVERSR